MALYRNISKIFANNSSNSTTNPQHIENNHESPSEFASVNLDQELEEAFDDLGIYLSEQDWTVYDDDESHIEELESLFNTPSTPNQSSPPPPPPPPSL